MDFLEKYKLILAKQIQQQRDFIICGDVNIVHKEIDIKNWKQNQKTSGDTSLLFFLVIKLLDFFDQEILLILSLPR